MAAVEERNRRILLIDGPAILGWETWREMDRAHSMRLLREQLGIMRDHGYFPTIPLELLTHFISGGLNETALWLANQALQPNVADETMKALGALLEGFKHFVNGRISISSRYKARDKLLLRQHWV